MHAETALTMIVAVSVTVPAACWLAVRGRSGRGGDYWFCGALLGGLGALLLVLRPVTPGMDPLLKFNATSLLLFLAVLLRWRAIDEELGTPCPLRRLARDAVAFVVIFASLRALGFGTAASLFAGGCNALVSWHMFLAAKRLRGAVPMASLVVILLFALQFFIAFSALFVLGLLGVIQPPVGPEIAVGPITLASLGFSVLANFAWVGVVVHRSNTAREQELFENEKAQQRARVSQQLARMEAKASIGVMSTALAHELGQPLATMLTTAQLCQRGLRDGRLGQGQLQGLFGNILAAVGRCSAIIEKTRLAHTAPVRADSVAELGEVVGQCVALGAADAEAAGVQVSVNLPGEKLLVRIDSVHLSQVLMNLLRNAVQAASAAPVRRVFIHVGVADTAVRLTVADTGSGVSPGLLDQVGTLFFTTRPEGLGMGIAVSRELLAGYGGTLELRNGTAGGLQATLEVPRAGA